MFGATLPYEECVERYQEPLLNDLRGGLNIYEKIYRQALCTRSENTRGVTAQYIDTMVQTTNDEDFEKVKKTANYNGPNLKYSFVEPEVTDSIFDDKVTEGYQAYEFLRGYSMQSDGSKKYAYDDRLLIQRTGFFGHCQADYPIKFMENLKIKSCVLADAIRKMDAGACEAMSGQNLFDFRINAGDGVTEITPRVGTQMKFDLNDFKEVQITPQETFLATSLNAGACSCDNVVLEAHFKIYFDYLDAETSQGNQYIVKDVVVDTVYGTTKTDACSTPKHYELKTSLTYLQFSQDQQQLSHRYSGSPGYIKGHPIMIGVETKAKVTDPVTATETEVDVYLSNMNGFPLRGADSDGLCYWTQTPVYEKGDPVTYSPEFLINNLDEKLYLDDPVLTFADDMMFGCSLQFTFDELKTFCDSKGWSNLVLIQNLY